MVDVVRYRGELEGDEVEAAAVVDYEVKIAALERKVGQLTMELDLLKKTPRLRLVSDNETSSIISGPKAAGFVAISRSGRRKAAWRLLSAGCEAVEAVSIRYDETLVAVELPLLDHVHGLDAGDDYSSAPKGIESKHRSSDSFDGALQKSTSCSQVALGGEQEVDSIARAINVSGWRTHIESMSLRGDSVHYEDSAHQFERG